MYEASIPSVMIKDLRGIKLSKADRAFVMDCNTRVEAGLGLHVDDMGKLHDLTRRNASKIEELHLMRDRALISANNGGKVAKERERLNALQQRRALMLNQQRVAAAIEEFKKQKDNFGF